MLKFSARRPKLCVVRLRLPTAVFAAAAMALAAAPAALADSSVSSNWAGYAVHRSGQRFRKVSAIWKQPSASCTPGNPTYSAVWVGLGGFSQSSNALEQIGTEVDCSASGSVVSSAWFELVPDASSTIRLGVRPGDTIAASVTVVGHKVTVQLYDATRHRSFSRTLYHPAIDLTSAEWIVEAPSDCISANVCRTLPLADFGTTVFALTAAKSTRGQVGSISNRAAWGATSITLAPGGRRFVGYQTSGIGGTATPSSLGPAGASFSVTYQQGSSSQTNPFFGTRRAADLSHR
jgi:hypothetical protein